MTLGELEQEFITAMADERTGAWRAGDVLLQALAVNARHAPSPEAAKAKRPEIFKAFATAGGCSPQRCKQLAFIAASVEPGLREAGRSWSWHRSIVHAAERTGRLVSEVLVDATVNGWGVRELQALSATVERVGWHGECGGCGFRVSVSCKKPGIRSMAGDAVACPVCTAGLGRLA